MYLGELTPIQESQLVQLKSWVSELLKGKVRILSFFEIWIFKKKMLLKIQILGTFRPYTFAFFACKRFQCGKS